MIMINSESVLLDPTAELVSAMRSLVGRPAALDGNVVGLLDIGKMRGDEFIDRLEQILLDQDVTVRRYKKPTNVKVAPRKLLQQIVAECDVVIEALADCGSCTSCAIHDINDLDALGIPGGIVATDEFVDAAKAQSEALGFQPAIVWVAHPMQNRTTEELYAFADDNLEEIIGLVVAQETS